MKTIVCILFLAASLISCTNEKNTQYQWYKGNTHCHSTISDGDNPVKKVIKSYHDRGYNFLVVTDHNFLVDTDTVLYDEPLRNDFLLIQGEEVTDQKSVHTTALNISEYVRFSNDPNQEKDLQKRREEITTALRTEVNISKSEILQMHVDGIRKAGGTPFLNHPNFADGLQVEDIFAVTNLHHMELYNGHPYVYNWGKEEHISVEAKWDSILSRGHIMYGVAADDMHNLETRSEKDANPFRGWIMVKSKQLTPHAIQAAINNGDFYSTTSVTLKTCEMNAKKCVIEVDPITTMNEVKTSLSVPRIDETGEEGFLIEFIGQGGKVLAQKAGIKARYKLQATDRYVRSRITYCEKTESGYEKRFAWTQPVFMN
ncbi:CehA/McbA family metallohydrolase [Prolixibacteraceae bacterium Z1-6]|uniref:CehA/McbA family metallohydrolase n=1 Tax=Draconibacterium aestuarii TaxID=2998507 RepID=A0A9X3F2P6_9BACT|nr:CehA/McbA family metallohydrolase [Prolixibacteraceae bacterium Z1-6]